MPGICGIVRKNGNEGHHIKIKTMVKSMMHDKNFISGIYENNKLGISAGWVCLERSFLDCLPIWNEDNDVCLILSGEIFSDDSEFWDLKRRGHEVNKENASYLVHMYEELGIDFLKKLNGVFSGIITDLRTERIYLFNDRYNVERIYYHNNAEGLYFSSEAKSLLKIFPELRTLKISQFTEIFQGGREVGKSTIFSDISMLHAGSVWMFDPSSKIQKEIYSQIDDWAKIEPLSEKEYFAKIKNAISKNLPKYFGGDQRVAISLADDVGTKIIMAWASYPPFKLPCYTFKTNYGSCENCETAKVIAAVCQQYHETIPLKRKFFAEFAGLAKRAVYLTDGSLDITGSVELYFNRIARKYAPVRIIGDFADHILMGVMDSQVQPLNDEIFSEEFAQQINNNRLAYHNLKNDWPFQGDEFQSIVSQIYGTYMIRKTMLTPRLPFLDNQVFDVAVQGPLEYNLRERVMNRLIVEGNAAMINKPNVSGDLFHKAPKIEKKWRLYLKAILKAKKMTNRYNPKRFLRIKKNMTESKYEKQNFDRNNLHHFRCWYQKELSHYMKSVLLDHKTLTRPYINGKYLENMVNSHVNGFNDYTNEINWVLTSEMIQRNLIDRI